MLFSLVYFLVRRLLGAGGRRPDEKDIELLVLRQRGFDAVRLDGGWLEWMVEGRPTEAATTLAGRA